MTPPRSHSRRLRTLAMVLAAAAIVCRLAFHAIGSRVDAAGVLREPFALVPISALLLLASGVAFAGSWSVRPNGRQHPSR
ncbi:MAG: DUF3955 domain-containing protein [Cyanobium sp.]